MSGFTIKNFRVVTAYDDPVTSHAFIEPLRVDRKVMKLMDIDFRCQGTIVFADTVGFNWHMENIVFETQNLFRFSKVIQRCSEEGSFLDTKVYFKNITSVNKGPKPPYLHIEQSLSRNYMVGDIHMEGIYFDTYLGYKIGIVQTVWYLLHTG